MTDQEAGTRVPGNVLVPAEKAGLGSHELTLDNMRPVLGGLTVWTFEHGFITEKEGAKTLYRWDECHLWYSRTVHQGVAGGVRRVDTSFTVQHENGVRFAMSSTGSPQVGEFLDKAIRKTTAARLPIVREALRAGKGIDFGPLQLDLRAIRHKGSPIPWPEVDSVGFGEGAVTLSRSGKRKKSSVPASGITDLHVFLYTVDAIPVAPRRQMPAYDDMVLRKWAKNVVTDVLTRDDFVWARTDDAMGAIPMIDDEGRRKLVNGLGVQMSAPDEQMVVDAAHAAWGVTENVHYRANGRRIVLVDRADRGLLFDPGDVALWSGLAQALAARHGLPILG